MSPRHAVRRRPRRLWWTVAAGNAALGAAVLTAVVVSFAPGAPAEDTSSASVATVTGSPDGRRLAQAQTRSGIGDGWASASSDGDVAESSASSRSTSSRRPTTASRPSTSVQVGTAAPSAAAGASVSPSAPEPVSTTDPTTPAGTTTPTETTTLTETTTPADTTTPTQTTTPTETDMGEPDSPDEITIPPIGGITIPPMQIPEP